MDALRVSLYISIIGLVIALGVLTTFSLFQRSANAVQYPQTYVIVGWGGKTIGLANIISDGHQTTINLSTPYIPPQGKTFEAWLVDGNYGASGYTLSLGQFDEKGILRYRANLVNAYTYTDLAVTVEPKDDPDPKPAASNQVGVSVLSSPFGK
jgi:hypothetical protein